LSLLNVPVIINILNKIDKKMYSSTNKIQINKKNC